MCGILCEINCTECSIVKDKEIMERIKNRGPDFFNSIAMRTSKGNNITFCSSVLWMQGPEIVPQPFENENGVLLYNGDIFDDSWDINISDTEMIMEKLCNVADIHNSECEVISVLKSLKGPFSIIYYEKTTEKLYYTRDRIGRNSLLFFKNDNSIVISSVLGRKYKCVEIPATHIHILNLKNNMIKLYQWNNDVSEVSLENWFDQLQEQQNIPDDEFNFVYDTLEFRNDDNLIEYMEKIVQENKDKLIVMKKLMIHSMVEQTVMKIIDLLLKSVEIRLKRQPNKCKQCLTKDISTCNHCTVGILFSGGLDCTILALLADKYLPSDQPIDLINIAFKKDNNTSYDVPDRITGLQSLEELQKVSPLRNWVFKTVNISTEELEKFQASSIADLVYPRQTILDESLGSALWFASKAQDVNNMISTSRVLLLGSGADELFGGYIRHRKAFKRFGWAGLNKELQLDWKRISFRNLARDNRVICDHSRQPRMPYLDDDFADFVLQLDPWLKCFPCDNLGLGIGDKLMLRLVALKIGLEKVAVLPKRALQFGSRIANKNEKGCDISKNFLSK